MDHPTAITDFWARFRAATGHPDAPFRVGGFAEEHPEVATELAALVLTGTKRATTGLLQEYMAEGEPLPQPGDLWIVTDGTGGPVCVTRTTSVEQRRYADVDEAFAFDEGESDKTLAGWRRAHAWHFDSIGHPVDDDTLLVLERFEKLWP
jgi:uncharacterized protein YhfF